jgi:hypothetical protein
MRQETLSFRAQYCDWLYQAQLCHSERSIAIGFIKRNAEWRNLLLFAACGTQGTER